MKRFVFYFLLFGVIKTSAQQNCPAGYEERTVKCNGQFVQKCVPINYACKLCWAVEYPPCPGHKDGGSDYFSSYERAFTAAQKEATGSNWNTGKCLWYDNRSYKIYLDESKFCTTSNINLTALNDLKNKIMPFLMRYLAEINNYKQHFSGYPVKPGAIVKEYAQVLEQAEENARKLQSTLSNLTDQNLSEIETAFNNIQNEEIQLQQKHSSYENYIKNNDNSNNTATNTLSRPTTINNQQNNINNNQQLQNQLNSINQQFQTRQENNQQLFNTLQSGIQNIADILIQNSQRKAEERQRQFEFEQQRREQRVQAQLDEERRKREEEDRINAELMRQFSLDSIVLSNNNLGLKTSAISPNIDSVYYIGYKRQYDEQQTQSLYLKVFVVYRYSDGTFPLFSNVVEKSKFENNINRYGITLLVGFFGSQSDALRAVDEIQANAKTMGINSVADRNFRKINIVTASKTKDNNFWNQ